MIKIPSIFKNTFNVYRRAPGSYVAGRWVDGAESSFTIEASLQPLTGSELNAQLLLLPEGERRREMRKLYTETVLNTVNEKAKTPADQIDVDGDRFEVMSVNPHKANNNSHVKVILARVN